MLSTNWENYDRSEIERKIIGVFLGGGLILKPNGHDWKNMRTLVAPAFKYSSLQVDKDFFG
jgi:hypothetical protein